MQHRSNCRAGRRAPNSLDTTTMRPERCLRNVGRSARVSAMTPIRFVSMTRRISASGMSSKAPPAATPALCTTASRKSSVRASVSATPLAIDAASVTSSCTILTFCAAPDCASAASSGPLRSKLRIVAMTRQPRFASSTAARSPKPADVPVIRTVRIRAPLKAALSVPGSPAGRSFLGYMGLYICCKCHWRTSERAARGRPCKVWKFATSAAQYTRAFGSMYLTSLVIVCVCTGR